MSRPHLPCSAATGALVGLTAVAAGVVPTAAQAAQAAPAAPLSAPVTAASPVRPAPAPFTATTLPDRVAIGSPVVAVPFTAWFAPESDNSAVDVGLTYLGDFQRATGPTQYRVDGRVTVQAEKVERFGPTAWRLTRTSRHGSGVTVDQPTRVGLQSLLGQSVTRTGNRVRVVGALKGYDIASDSFPARPSTPVAIQRYSSSGWVTVATIATDRLGHLDRTLDIPWRVGIRLSTPDATWRFGATTASTVV